MASKAERDEAPGRRDEDGGAGPSAAGPEPPPEQTKRTTRRRLTDGKALVDQTRQATEEQPAELRDFLSTNGGLLSSVTTMTGLAALITGVLPKARWVDDYIEAAAVAAVLLLMLEFYAQWPREVQPHRVVRGEQPMGHSWRFLAFAWVMCGVAVTFVAWVLITKASVLVPLLALPLAYLLWRSVERRWPGARRWRAVGVVAALLCTEIVLTLLFPERRTLLRDVLDAARGIAG